MADNMVELGDTTKTAFHQLAPGEIFLSKVDSYAFGVKLICTSEYLCSGRKIIRSAHPDMEVVRITKIPELATSD